jgi:hypothetical protein
MFSLSSPPGWVARPNLFERVSQCRGVVEANTLKLRLGVAPDAAIHSTGTHGAMENGIRSSGLKG